MESSPPRHVERLTAPAPWWALIAVAALVVGWLLLVATSPAVAGAVALAVLVLLAAGLWRYGSLRITAEPGRFRIGEARLDAPHLGGVAPLDPAAWRAALDRAGVDRAFLLTRPWIDRGVRIEVVDAADPTPYWLVSSRRPDALSRAVSHTGAPDRRSSDGEEAREDDGA